MHRVFLLSPAHSGGVRARMLLREGASFPLACAVRSQEGAPLGEVFAFLSGLYFRGKLAYANAFAKPPRRVPGALVITPTEGLVDANERVTRARLVGWGAVDIDENDPRYRDPMLRSLESLSATLGKGSVVLLGSIATAKYTAPLLTVFGERVVFPSDFVGRGDMSRGGLLLRQTRAGEELAYVPVLGATRRGARPPKLARLPRRPPP